MRFLSFKSYQNNANGASENKYQNKIKQVSPKFKQLLNAWLSKKVSDHGFCYAVPNLGFEIYRERTNCTMILEKNVFRNIILAEYFLTGTQVGLNRGSDFLL